jgi:hypothetical protein
MSTMIFYHRGAAFTPLCARVGRTFVATASILEEDGNVTSLGKLGVFASKKGALTFAVRCAAAFIDGEDLPLPPFQFDLGSPIARTPESAAAEGQTKSEPT